MRIILKYFYKYHLCHLTKNKINTEDAKIIYAYRYLSWALTSFVYLTGKPNSVFIFKFGVILSLFVSSVIFTDLYMKFKENTKTLKIILLSETLGIALLLLPTDGLASPFIWYALNPTLVAANSLPAYFCWINLSFYLLTGSIITYYIFNPNNINLLAILVENYNLALAFVLITLVVQLLANLTNKLSIQSNALKLSNEERQESMNYIMTLYQIMEAMDKHITKDKLFRTLADYTSSLMNSKLCVYLLPCSPGEDEIIQFNKSFNFTELQTLLYELKTKNLQQKNTKEVSQLMIGNYCYLTIPIFITTASCGLIATQIDEFLNKDELDQRIKLLEFLSGLCSITLERFYIEEIEIQLLVNDEQNRIANEIHDSVSQRLFSICYGVHGVLKRGEDISYDELQNYLLEIHESSQIAMEELRNSIYKLSSKKKGEKSLSITLKAFLDSMAKLHHIVINFNISGDEFAVSLQLKQVITRIVREACGNAIRHGVCNTININLLISSEFISISILDDGKGFYINAEKPEFKIGLGLSNMRSLVTSYNGTMNLSSKIGDGTNIQFMIPLKNKNIDESKERMAI